MAWQLILCASEFLRTRPWNLQGVIDASLLNIRVQGWEKLLSELERPLTQFNEP